MFRSRQLLTSALFALLVLALVAAPAGAGKSWCRSDPIVRLGDTEYQIIVSVPDENLAQVDGALLFEIYSPPSTEQELLFVDSGLNGHGEEVVFMEHESLATHVFALDVQQTGQDFQVMMDIYVGGELIQTARGTSREMWVPVPINR